MWVIDAGMSNADAHCPPQLLLYDLNTDELLHRYRFPASLYTRGASLFITPLADVRDPPPRGSCRRTMVYVADVNYHGLVVYDFMQNKAWRVENMFMYPDPNHGLHSLAGEKFVLMDGIFGLATDKKNLYFHPLASATEFAVPLRIIDNSTLFENNVENMYEAFRPLGKRSSECAASAMDSNGNLYCVTLYPIELIVWNVNTAYDKKNLKKLPISSEELEFVSGMKVIRNNEGNEELWMISNRYQVFLFPNQVFNGFTMSSLCLYSLETGSWQPRFQ